ncbi:MAG: DUF5916 domain-containing protein [Bacteroidales bacterium]|nr:DUF5916 domain-containing protein [Bacteroidales bacterium]
MKHFCIVLVLWLLCSQQLLSQEKRQLEAQRITGEIKLDGVPDEPIWQQAPVATDFYQMRPFSGRPASLKTEVRLLFDDYGLYVSAVIFDDKPDSLRLDLSKRDDKGMADHFGFHIDPYNDGLNAFGFYVTARGVQIDLKTDKDGMEDYSWDAVWNSNVNIHDQGWTLEIIIPWSALRFPKTENHAWGINFFRSIQRLRETNSWNYIDNNIMGLINQSGNLQGIDNIRPPLRLSATPYLSGYMDHNGSEKDIKTYGNYGMDVKWGLSKSFTLDMTLIPDFGQVESDDKIFSLSPFETYYVEKRPFFTEGTELFNKGKIFYSRRIGSTPSGYASVMNNPDFEIIDNPESSQLINAMKLSGKTSAGLGIGVFNAMTANTYATVKDTSGDVSKILTEPFTNFNMVVADQALKNNSYFSIYNTSVYKPEERRSANVSGTDFRFRNADNRLEFSGILNLSQHYHHDFKPKTGFRTYLKTGKVSGTIQYDAWLNIESDDYNPNDMGYLMNNNDFATGATFRYNIYEPKGKILRMYNTLTTKLVYLYLPRKYSEFNVSGINFTTFKNHFTLGGNFTFRPLPYYDFFEARIPGTPFLIPSSLHLNMWTSPDYRKKFLVDLTYGGWSTFSQKQSVWWIVVEPRWRINNSMLLRPAIQFNFSANDQGFVAFEKDQSAQTKIIFGRRDVKNVTSTLTTEYIFSRHTSLSFRLRHYWLRVNYLEFLELVNDGKTLPTDYSSNQDFSVNAFNIDMVFKWDFAPGSELLLIWKNAIFDKVSNEAPLNNYFENIDRMFQSPIHNSLSIKLLYYLDWQYFRKLSRGKPQRETGFLMRSKSSG